MLDLAIIFIIFWGLFSSNNLIRKIMCLGMAESMLILLFLKVAQGNGKTFAPILGNNKIPLDQMVDPVPQALMLTAIVIGTCFNALALAFLLRLYRQTGTILASELGRD